MSRLFFGLILMAAAIGCTGIQSAGPLSKSSGSSSSTSPKMDKDMSPPDPVMIPAPTPAAPKCLIRPEDVNSDNADYIQKQLKAELESDRKNMPSVPVTAEVSEYKGSFGP